MNSARQLEQRTPDTTVFLDEGVPVEVGHTFESHGQEVIPFDKAVKRGSVDSLVCTAAQANDAILVAFDKDMKQFARRDGVGRERFKRLSLIRLQCNEVQAAARVDQAMTFIEHEWAVSDAKAARRMHVSIGKQTMRSHR